MATPKEELHQQNAKRIAKADAIGLGAVIRQRYQVIAYLGRGGMSTVYKALDMRSGRTIALKVLHSELLSDNTRVQRFLQEAKTYRNLRHRHIVKTYDFFNDENDRYCMVMEYHEGRNLSEVLAETGRLSIRRAIKVFSEICDALDHAHSQGIVHRDLKPSNIALCEKGSDSDYVKVLDFGIAKMMPHDDETRLGLTQTGEIVGSPLYMSPEQCMAKSIDHRSDVYSLGCLMYEALVGEPPLMGGNVYETFHRQTHDCPRALGDVRPEYKSGTYFEHIIFKCMAKNPKHRYQTMSEVKEALDKVGQVKSSSAIEKIADSLKQRQVRKRAEKGTGIPPLVAAGVTALLVIGLIFVFQDKIWQLIEPAETRYTRATNEYRDAFTSGNYEKAEREALKALKVAEEEHPEWLTQSLINVIDLYRIEGKLQLADSLSKRVFKLQADDTKVADQSEKRLLKNLKTLIVSGTDRVDQIEDYCFQLSDLAVTYIDDGKLERAAKLLKDTLRLAKTALGEKSLVIANIRDNLALLKLKDNLDENYEQMEEDLKAVVENRETIAGGESSGLIRTLEALSEVQRRRGSLEEASENALRALSIARNAYRSNSIQAALARCQVAEIYLALKKPSSAASTLSTALTSMDRLKESDYLGQARCRILLGEAQAAQQKYSDAIKEFDSSAKLLKEGTNDQVLLLSQALVGFGDVYSSNAKKDIPKAKAYYKRALALLLRSRAREEARVLDILAKIKKASSEEGVDTEMLELYKIVENIDRETGKAKGVIEDQQLIGNYYKDSHSYKDAGNAYETALSASQHFYGVESEKTCELLALLAETYLKGKNVSKAAPLIEESVKTLHSEKLAGKVSRKVQLQVLSTYQQYLSEIGDKERWQQVKEEIDSV